MKGETLYEAVWECRFPRKQAIEEEVVAPQALTPDMAEDPYFLFE